MSSIPTLEEIEDLVLELKDTSELMIDMAFSSLIYHSEDLAEEVRLLEDHVDGIHSDVQVHALEGARQDVVSIDQALALARLSEATERIADSAREIADVVLRDVEPHPVLAASIEDSDVVFVRLKVQPDADLAGKPLEETRVQSETGMHIFAVRRHGHWHLGPDAEDVLEVGDVLMASGPEEGREKLRGLCGTDPDEES